MGRKVEYTIESLPKDWKDMIFEMMSQGKSRETVMKAFKISRTVHARFMNEYPEYEEAFQEGDLLREVYVYEQVLLASTDKDGYKGNPTMLMFLTKNVLGWRSEPFHKDKEGVLGNETEKKELLEKFKKKEKKDEKSIDSGAVIN